MSDTLKHLDGAFAKALRDLLAQCSEKQRNFFSRQLYPMGIDNMSEQQIRRAIEQCEATIAKTAKNAKN